MKPEAQRIKIAEVCGWKQCDPVIYGSDQLYHIKGQGYALRHDMPDYLNDLNAMHEAWGTLSNQQKTLFQQHLRETVLGLDDPRRLGELSWIGEAKVTNATAAQRAEAFLRTLDLWVDD